MLGFCTELKCLVYEYVDIENSTLQDVLISSADDNPLKKKLQWQDRIRIAAEIGSALCYLHQLQPEATGHGKLTGSNVFIDSNLVVKVDFVQPSNYSKLYVIYLDVKAFGKLMNLITGFSGEIDYSLAERLTLIRSLEETAGQWPQDLAEKLVDLSRSCNSISYNSDVEFYMETVKTELEEIRKKAECIVSPCTGSRGAYREDSNDEIPSAFLCPIYQVRYMALIAIYIVQSSMTCNIFWVIIYLACKEKIRVKMVYVQNSPKTWQKLPKNDTYENLNSK